ncbi:NADP-dependent malic enzyme [Brucepastera parasyntrophica]|uniref:NAD(P)-dependent malic enzyme n=1 Tax=Brucepastera parasyntrophica TaxID=2880008 RepID=UPI00210D76D2|nr:NADP-dependent malic enzyme [Brucepastera parasyntrophica]ULQ59644.1 NADP-dependent malic enzyme [Brucepastera parasyntrophica]
MKPDISLNNFMDLFPADFSEDEKARGKTLFLKKLSMVAHKWFGGKMQTLPKCGIYGFNWFNVWYTPGVSAVSTSIRDDNDTSFTLSNRGNLVAVVSNSTRVLGDGDCTPPGGLGVMEGKAMLMKYLGGVDSIPLCIDSRVREDEAEKTGIKAGKHDPQKIIEFVRMLEPSVGAVNLEDISQPDCFLVLDTLRDVCNIPVWHDDAQGTACVTLAGLLNALKLAGKKISDVKIVLLGAGASNTTIARLILADGGDPEKMIICDSRGPLHSGREDIEKDARYYRKWELCLQTNPGKISTIEEAMDGADVLIALSTPGPGTVKKEWISSMSEKSIVFVCANPVPEIWPHEAKEAGAFIVATGRGDFPNQVNNSICFPGILKGALLVRSRKITDGMAITCAHSIADYSEKKGIDPEHILVSMEDTDVFAVEAADVAMKAIDEEVARITLSWQEVYDRALADIQNARTSTRLLMDKGLIEEPPREMLEEVLDASIKAIISERESGRS